MTKSKRNPKIDVYLTTVKSWREEMTKLRKIILDCQLTEELKWGKPCYAFEKSNVVIIQGFKKYCALLFFKGVLLQDPHGVLKKTGVNTRVGRQIRFTNVGEIVGMERVLKTYIRQAIEVEKSGVKVNLKGNTKLKFPEEFQNKLNKVPALKAAFDALTPGRQRAYNLYFCAPKQSKTRATRVDKCIPQILNGRGLNDR